MGFTTVLLREDMENLGGRGEMVRVRAGYARNFLLPQGLAMMATKSNIAQVENERASLLAKAAKEKSTADAQAAQMKDLSLTFERKAGEHGILYGSVTTMDIAEAIQAKGYEVDRRRLTLSDAIKELGDYTVKLRLHRDVTIEIPVEVTGEGGIKAADLKKDEKGATGADSTIGEPLRNENAADNVRG
ncbi:MAG: 50S ribosomal protein L9 [Pyrinomonadaceae bacterium]|nr:50S ribosomal protein L9 [Pyrinomonadaceae bacterium]